MTLEPAGPEAAAALAAAHAEAFDRPWSAADLADLAASPGVVALAVRGEHGIDGFIMVRAIVGEAEILTLAVRPAARRRGLGAALVEASSSACAGLGCEALWLEVAEDNAAARALYARAGFEPVGRRPRYYARPSGPPMDALVLRRRLNSAAA